MIALWQVALSDAVLAAAVAWTIVELGVRPQVAVETSGSSAAKL